MGQSLTKLAFLAFLCCVAKASQTFLLNLLLLVGLNLLVKPFFILVIDVGVQNATGAEVYGRYFTLFNFGFILSMLTDFGLTQFNNRFISRAPQVIARYLPKMLALRIALALIYLFTSVLLAIGLGYDVLGMDWLLLILFNHALVSLIFFLRSGLTGVQRFTEDAIVSVLDRGLMILFIGLLLWGGVTEGPFQIEWFLYAQASAYSLTIVVLFILLTKEGRLLRLDWDRTFFLVALRRSWPYALLILLMGAHHRIEVLLLEDLHPLGQEQAGIYAQSWRLMDAVNNFSFLFAGLLFPLFSKLLATNEDVRPLVRLASRILFIGLIALAVPCTIYSKDIIEWRYVEHLTSSSHCFQWAVWISVLMAFGHVYGSLLLAQGKVKLIIAWMAGSILVNVICSVILVPGSGALGAVQSSLLGHLSMAIAYFMLCRKRFDMQMDGRIVLAALSIIGLSALSYQMGLFSGGGSRLFMAFLSTGCLMVAFLYKDLMATIRLFIE
jgi:O-antigen/teichoic acid export membrane protein